MTVMDERAGTQFLSFTLRDEQFAVEIAKVREVLDVSPLTRIPRMPSYLCGVINLRGNVVPVVDLGLKLGMPAVQRTVNTCIMIIEVHVEGEATPVLMGALTDAVQAVFDINPDQIEPAPKMGMHIRVDFIRGMARQENGFLILLDLDTLLSLEGEAVAKAWNQIAPGIISTPAEREESGGGAEEAAP